MSSRNPDCQPLRSPYKPTPHDVVFGASVLWMTDRRRGGGGRSKFPFGLCTNFGSKGRAAHNEEFYDLAACCHRAGLARQLRQNEKIDLYSTDVAAKMSSCYRCSLPPASKLLWDPLSGPLVFGPRFAWAEDAGFGPEVAGHAFPTEAKKLSRRPASITKDRCGIFFELLKAARATLVCFGMSATGSVFQP
jgi:hypothetical protein